MKEVRTVAVCGAGTMGAGIAQVCAMAGFDTLLFDVNEAALSSGKIKIETELKKLEEKNRISQTIATQTWARLQFTSDINVCKGDLIIEAIVEKMEAKLALFQQLIQINTEQAILATNTSSLSVQQIEMSLNSTQQLIGLHFFNPAPLMKLVEIVKTNKTTTETLDTMLSFVERLNKTGVVCKDAPGFIVNRVARPYYIESLRLVEEGNSTVETADRLLEAIGFKMGPFKLMDLIGNDVNYAVSCSVYEQLDKPDRLKPSFIQKEKVDKGELGKKSGKGYYEY
jgi:3-hydroxybutyryl-CoA dehydrogenase